MVISRQCLAGKVLWKDAGPLGLTPAYTAHYAGAMEVHLTPDQQVLIRQVIESGRYQTPEDVIQDAMGRWEEGERARVELLSALDEAEADLAGGRYTDYTAETSPELARELKSEARALRHERR